MSWKLLHLKKQIKSIRNTAKITKAMELVAASKMKSFQKKTGNIRNFVFDLLCILWKQESLSRESIFVKKRSAGKTAFILYSSDKGLCGALNQRLFKTLTASKVWTSLKESDRIVITVGKKAFDFCRFNGIPIEHNLENAPENLDSYSAAGFIDKIVDIWKSGEPSRIYMVAPHYKNSLIFYPLVKQFLPLSPEILKSHMDVDPESIGRDSNPMKSSYTYVDSDTTEVSNELTMMIAKLLFIHAFYELKASEYSSRMVAMKNATDSAKKMSKRKTLQLNKERQAVITQQISEIVSWSL